MKTKANPKSKSPNGNPKMTLKSNPKMIPQSETLQWKPQNEDPKSNPKMILQSETLKWNAQTKYLLRCSGGVCKQTEAKKDDPLQRRN